MSHCKPTQTLLKSCHTIVAAGWIVGFFLIPQMMRGQDSLLLRDFSFIKSDGGWLTSQNAALLTQWKSRNISEAELAFKLAKGGLTDFSGSRDTRDVDASIESFYRINPHTVTYGRMSYNYFTGKDMGGSAFIDPARKPFDIEEDSITNLGKKHRDTYQLSGGVGIDIYRGISLGAKIDYTAANYAKYKDLRHKNKLMDMTLTAGVLIPVSRAVQFGANYYYRRNTESTAFNTYGREEKVYKSFINYGPFIGEVEQFSNSGFTEKSRENPLVDDYNGGSLQAKFSLGHCFTMFHEMMIAHREGYFGRKSPYTITFSNHDAEVYEYHGQLCFHGDGCRHQLDATVSVENLENRFAHYREKSNESGAYYYEYYDDVKTANKVWVTGHIAYTAHLGIRGELPAWSLTASYDWGHRKQTAYKYPYYRRQKLDNQEMRLKVVHNHLLRRGILSCGVTGAFKQGEGDPFEDLTFTTPSDKQSAPSTMDVWLYQEHRWLTSPQYLISGSLKYTTIIPQTKLAAFVKASVNHRKANATNDYCRGRDHTAMSFAVGCVF